MLNINNNISALFSRLIGRVVSAGADISTLNRAQSLEFVFTDNSISIGSLNILYERVFELLADDRVRDDINANELFSFLKEISIPGLALDKAMLSKGLWFLPPKDRDVDILRLIYSILSDSALKDGEKDGISSNHRQLLLGFMEMVLALRIYSLNLAREGILFYLMPFILDGRSFLVSMRFYGKRTEFYKKRKRLRFVCELFASVFGIVRLVLDMDEGRGFIWADIYAQRNLDLLKKDREGIEGLSDEINGVINIRPLKARDGQGIGVLNREV